jgi:Family of unknown function (DUF6263)
MKKFFLLILIFTSVAAYNCYSQAGKGKAINLKFNLPKGAGYDYNMNMDMAVKGEAGGQPVNVTNTMNIGYHFKAIDDSAGWKKLTSTVTRIALKVNAGGTNINFDTDQPVDTSDVISSSIAKALGALKGGEFGFTMNEKGDIGSVTGLDEMLQRMSTGDDQNSMGSAFNEESFKQNMQSAFGSYPDKPVKPGDSWSKTTTSINAGMPMNIESVYKLESVSGNIATVNVNSKISTSDTTSGNTTGTMTGLMKYDIPTGLPIDGDLTMVLDMNINAAGQTVPMNMNIKMKMTGKKS